MRFKIYAAASLAMAILLGALAVGGASLRLTVPAAVLLLAAMWLAWRSVSVTLRTMDNGMALLREHDFSSRLRRTGVSDADKAVDLFNSMMDTMKAERLKLLEQGSFLNQLTEVSPMGIAICDFEGGIIEANPAFRAMSSAALERSLATLAPGQTATFRLGHAQIYRCSRLWFMDRGFRRPFLLVERLTDEIAKAEKAIFRTIIRTIGHEVNNTMGGVASVLETMADIHADEPLASETLAGCSRAVMNLTKFVKGYADVVKLPDPVPEPADLGAGLRDLLPALRSVAGPRVRVELDIHPSDTLAMVDMALLDRVVTNIVKNSAESIATRPAAPGDTPVGSITITLDRGTDLAITDDGPGITPEAARRLFTPFFSTKHPDRGLGLMLIADILRAHRAPFTLTTDPAASLTTFHITFPPAAKPALL